MNLTVETPPYESYWADDLGLCYPEGLNAQENGAVDLLAPCNKRFALLARRLAKSEEGKAVCARELGLSRQAAYRLTKELRQQGFQVP